ncbi:DUF3600 domain-containing protein [Paenibacillus sp. JX-17]|uniref:DUF3600 domain-containing protein n=1 Tax=Paenibacillus lacisoli TaxID=3064525 RepID=A0ABT9CFL8_9BACL|nr:DUF3600 domain-containing protein [Paenibacillus sp. JX-17]MDO7906476.1 DUF3600 domain-containing protein [Paenibacillus sp. JX-17]
MSIEPLIRQSLHSCSSRINPPEELDVRIRQSLSTRRKTLHRNKRVRQMAVVAIIGSTAALTLAFSNQHFADRIYGSYQNLQKAVVNVTMQEYVTAGMKFMGASRELGDDYPAFQKLARQLTSAKLQYGDAHQQINFSQLSPAVRAEVKQKYADIQPYFDRLNHEIVIKDKLSAAEYDAYIEAMIRQESTLAQAHINPSAGPVDEQRMPEPYRAQYQNSQRILDELKSKAMNIH